MKKFLSLIVLLVMFSPLIVSWASPKDRLYEIYSEYNSLYFGSKLPKEVVIDHSEAVQMATTMKMPDGYFHIAFNDKYTAAEVVQNLVLLHEMCHVKTWGEQPTDGTFDQSRRHGPLWRSCMLELNVQGVFRREIIEGYTGD